MDHAACTTTAAVSATAPAPEEDTIATSEESSNGTEAEGYFSDSDAQSDASDMFHVGALATDQMTWLTSEDAELERIQRFAQILRRRHLLPMNPEGETMFEEVETGICLPHAHCAFKGCSWTLTKPALD